MLLKEIRNIFQKELELLYPKEEIDSFFYLMISHYLGLEKFALVFQPKRGITKKEEQPFFEGLAALKKGIPLQYVLGETEFNGLKLLLNKEVLIPRPETEELVHWILSDCKNKDQSLHILDIGTGSGCIAISLAKELSTFEVSAFDISKEALEVAKKNAKLNNVNIEFKEVDILNTSTTLSNSYDIIVSNPPYVKNAEKAQMHQNVLENEPHQALFVSDENPLKFYKAIIKFSIKRLVEKGLLYLEINETEGEGLKELLKVNGFINIEIRKDIFGKHRMIKASFSRMAS